MHITILPEFFLWAMLATLIGVSVVLRRSGHDTIAWAVFLLLAFPAVATIIYLRTVTWPSAATHHGQALIIARLFGSYLAVSVLSLPAIFIKKSLGMVVALLVLANLNYAFGIDIFGSNLPIFPPFFASIALALAHQVVERGWLQRIASPPAN